MRHTSPLLWIFLLTLSGCTLYHPQTTPAPGLQTPQSLDKTTPHHTTYNYLLYLPKSYTPKKSYPLVLFLHGAGERGTDVNQVRSWGPPKLIDAGQQFDFILVSPQCPPNQWWRIDDLEVLLGDLLSRYPIDRSRLYLTGLSMGGCATWDWLLRSPHLFAAAVPICGWSNPVTPAYVDCQTPVWAFHGQSDKVVPPEGSQRMVQSFQKRGVEARLTLYPGVGHNAWSRAYSTLELFPWLLSHRLPTTRPVK